MDKNIPFVFGVKAEGDVFTDRVTETENLVANFRYGQNTIIISPRRMGKTSLVSKAANMVMSDDIRVARMDAFGCRSERDFVDAFATAVIRATSTKWEEWLENVKVFLTRFVPKISMGEDPMTDFSISFEYNEQNRSTEDILALPELIAKAKGIRIIVCVDEFQQIGEFANSLDFQKKLRGIWQLQQHVTYCLYGSKKHMMEKMFQNRSYPFYQFGDIMHLKKISREDWITFIMNRFETTGKQISQEFAGRICDLTECYSSYVQQLAWYIWLHTQQEVGEADVQFGISRLLDANESLYIQQTESLTEYQMNFLKALSYGVHTGFSQQQNLKRFRYGTAANIVRIKNSLKERDLTDSPSPNHLEISDPILGLWLRKRVWGELL